MDNVTEGSVLIRAAELPLYAAGRWIQLIWIPVIVLVGLPTNTLCVLVARQKSNRRMPFYNYVGFLAVLDNIVLILLVHYYISGVLNRQMSSEECKFLSYVFHCASMAAAYTILLMTTDRLMATRYAMRYREWNTLKYTRFALAVMTLICVIFNIPTIWFSDVIDRNKCANMEHAGTQFAQLYAIISTLLQSALPFLYLLTMNSVIIMTLRRAMALRKGLMTNSGGNSQGQLTFTLLIVSFTLLSLTLPQYIRYIVYVFQDKMESPESYAVYHLVRNVSNKLYFTNSSVNFFLYCIGGKRFRTNLRQLCCNKNRKPELVYTTSNYDAN